MAQGENGPKIKRPMEETAPSQVSRSHLKQNAKFKHIAYSSIFSPILDSERQYNSPSNNSYL